MSSASLLRAAFFAMLGLLCCTSNAMESLVPHAMMGVWKGNVTYSPLGPQLLDSDPYNHSNHMAISKPDRKGKVYIRHLREDQLYVVNGDIAQYCFAYDNPDSTVTGSDTAPFYLASYDNQSLQFCWRGERLPSHKANCTGCDCAQWSLKLGGADRSNSTPASCQTNPP